MQIGCTKSALLNRNCEQREAVVLAPARAAQVSSLSSQPMPDELQRLKLIPLRGSQSPFGRPDAVQHASRSELLIQALSCSILCLQRLDPEPSSRFAYRQELQHEETDLQQQILARGCRSNDPEELSTGLTGTGMWCAWQDRGYEPSTVPRGWGCTGH